MKKIAFICMMCLAALTMRAQECAVLDFQLGTNVTAEETEFISYNFRTNFYPEKYKVIPIERVNKTIEGLGYDKMGMTRQQLLKVGRSLEVKYIVVGNLGKQMDEYVFDVQVIDVSTGTTVDSEGGNFQKSEYRDAAKTIALRLAYRM